MADLYDLNQEDTDSAKKFLPICSNPGSQASSMECFICRNRSS
jgi:hypothetical protein